MSLQPYLQLLRIPALPTSLLLLLLSRVPIIASGITLTLHVVSELGRGYGAAGLAGTATMLGTALGAPVLGRMIDHHGLRPVVALCGVASCGYWLSTPHLSYEVLLLAALPAGALVTPAGSISRQVIAALVPADHRRVAFSLDQVGIELAYMGGPILAILVSTQYSTSAALTGIGVVNGVLALALWYRNPPVRSTEESTVPTQRPEARSWVTGRFIAALSVAMGATFVLIGVELATIASLRASGDVTWTGVVIAVMGVASLIGGLIYGATRRSLSQLALMTLLTLLTLPVGLATQTWWLLALAVIPLNTLCAPTLAATAETVIGAVPHTVRGFAMGLQDSATRLGFALGSPFVGFVLDRAEPGWGFVAAAVGGLGFAAVGAALSLGGRRRKSHRTTPTSPATTG
ncbi:MFS transporter [Saccharomonospora sp.]|uniref:MFS transporter n=1 Tax=Saccharomonospora sp. TaxID=33913 RepID=UPI002624C8CA|nr:MFS transporter [Saccharomonospora sp.]